MKKNSHGFFITFEGPDGSGKTTISQQIFKLLQQQGYDVILTREPGGSKIAEQIRNIILDVNNTDMDIKTEALLYAASRRQHLVDIILPALKDNKIVISDRFLDSSLAYQGFGRQIGYQSVLAINEFAIEQMMPDLTIFLDIPSAIGLERIKNRQIKDRLDVESQQFHYQVEQGYCEIKKIFSHRFDIVDASQPIDAIVKEVLDIILIKYQKHGTDKKTAAI